MRLSAKPAWWLLLSAITSCDSVLQPEDIAMEYVLLQATPMVFGSGVHQYEIVADTLRLAADGSGSEVVVMVPTQGGPSFRRIDPYVYRIRGDSLELTFVCPPDADCTPPPHFIGKVTDTGLSLRSPHDPRVRREYDRVSRD